MNALILVPIGTAVVLVCIVFLAIDISLWNRSSLDEMERTGNWPGSGFVAFFRTKRRQP